MSENLISQLLEKNEKCGCGLIHKCAIKEVLIEDGAVKRLPEVLTKNNYKNVTLVSDNNTYDICGANVLKLLEENGNKVSSIVLVQEGMLVPDENKIMKLFIKIKPDTDVIIGIGSGVINDLCKFVSFKMRLPYFIVATAPSMDGYASAGAALIVGNMKVTYQTHTPEVIICDLGILKKAPVEMIKAGFGDMVGKYSAINDWKISSIITNERYCKFVSDLVRESLNDCIKYAKEIFEPNIVGIKKLIEGLIIVGIAMSYMDNSRPASGSEHHLSHFYEVKGILDNKPYFLHGIDVFYSTYITSKLRHKLLDYQINKSIANFDYETWETEIKRVFGNASNGVIMLQNSLGFYSDEKRYKNYENIIENWNEIKRVLLEVPDDNEIIKLLNMAGLNIKDFYNEYGADEIKDSIVFSKDLKDRYTIFWLLSDLGLLDEFSNDLD